MSEPSKINETVQGIVLDCIQEVTTQGWGRIQIEQGAAANILAGGGEFHADCEAALLEDDSEQKNIWGADWYPEDQEVTYESLINIRPSQNNRTSEIQDPQLRQRIEEVVKDLLGVI